MAETARFHEPEAPDVDEPRPPLQLVRDTVVDAVAGAVPEVGPPRIGRAAAIGYAVGFAITALAITLAGTLSGLGLPASLGLGVFVGMWGGGGFGFMMGGTLPFARHLDAEAARSTHHGRGEIDGPAAG